jgi:hypothetical protein
MQLIPCHGILEDLPRLVQFCIVVSQVYEIRLGGAGILDLLKAVGEWLHCYRAIIEEREVAVHPLEDTFDAGRVCR